ncbi:Glycosyltransferase involved in cell wall bisynthesis [Geodermatophilus amargosae]|uniref:Glycosyltransferase involved in cell wall bisynthesis n=1 Tax=Geodermatophilus amargosae TaxID=1296565 RepID=A0A1I6X5V3_9ACTN|nr:glycosyltransferase [Geodermatophilus amargosae]SFT33660.1 Glycosyltransferase involved in cell wall bisynthesis [Geodermatophilus amargosae]
MRVLMDAGPWLPVPPAGYGGLENVVATLTAELRRRGHTVVLAASGDSPLPVDGLVSAFPTGHFDVLGAPYAQVVGIAHAHAQAVAVAATTGAFDLVHTHLEVVGPAVLAALGRAAPPVLHTLHWDLHRNAHFYECFDGRGRVFFAGVSDNQVARGPERLRRQTLGAVPLAVPVDGPPPVPREDRDDAVLVLARLCELKGTDTAVRACRAAGVPVVLAGPVGPLTDRAALDTALATPGHPALSHPDVAWFLDCVEPLLDGDRARWVGTVSGAEKADLLRRARALLTPVRWEEPGGTAACEALAAGTPVVALARGCLPSLVDDGRTGLLADDEAGLTAALARIGEIDPEVCAAEARRRFAPPVMAAAYERLYAEVVRRARVRTTTGPRIVAPRSPMP